MIVFLQRYFAKVSPMFVDGTLYALIALFGYLNGYFGSDDAAKYIDAKTLFYLNGLVGGLGATFLAIKMFRSTQYAEHVDKKELAETKQVVRDDKVADAKKEQEIKEIKEV